MAKESKTIFEHIEMIEQEINWMAMNGHVIDDDVQTKINELSEKLQKLKKIVEQLKPKGIQ